MPSQTIKTVNFGKTKSGLITVGYTLYDVGGNIVSPRDEDGVYEVGTGTGIYAAEITFPNAFAGIILWDTGEGTSTSYASEEQNFTDSAASLAPELTSIKTTLQSDLTFVRDMIGGRWKIDYDNFQMIFYKEDNTTEVARFDLRDQTNSPSYLSVFDRRKAI